MNIFAKTVLLCYLILFGADGFAQTSTICSTQAAPPGWLKVDTHTDYTQCRNWEKYNVATIAPIQGKTEMDVCSGQPVPAGWMITNVSTNYVFCQLPQTGPGYITGYGTVTRIVKADALLEASICANQVLPTGWTLIRTYTIPLQCANPNTTSNTSYSANNVWQVRNNTISCALSVSPAEVPPGGSWDFTITGANLPSGASAQWFGTKDGVTDASGVAAGSVPYKQTWVNKPAWAGVYTRYAKIFNSVGSPICTTNAVTVTLKPPVCTLSASAATVNPGQSFSFTAQVDSSVPAGSRGYWYGTKNGVQDEFGGVSIPVPSSTNDVNQTAWVGKYVRWIEVRNGSEVQCITNKVNIELK